MKFNALLTNAVILHNALTSRRSWGNHWKKGGRSTPRIWPTPPLTEHINRFGEYSTHELTMRPEAYDPKLDVDFLQFRDGNVNAEGFGQAA